MSDYKANLLKKVSRFPYRLALRTFRGGPVRRNALYITFCHIALSHLVHLDQQVTIVAKFQLAAEHLGFAEVHLCICREDVDRWEDVGRGEDVSRGEVRTE